MIRYFILLFLLFPFLSYSQNIFAEKGYFTRQDSLRGSITKERSWWDLVYYHLDIKVEPDKKFIEGHNTVKFQVLEQNQVMQIDLQEPLRITKVQENGKNLKYTREGNVYLIFLDKKQIIGEINEIKISYKGKPKVAVRAPWDGGFSWDKDENGNHFIATSCQGLGASVWWPNKDHMYDEVDSMLISVNIPSELVNVSNGRLLEITYPDDKTSTYHWFVSNPINNYGVNINIGDYVRFSEIYNGEKGSLDIDYYVLRYNEEKAKVHFEDVPKMFDAFEYWFGPYPFYEDSYKLVEVPYLGMEHQSSITYGNKYLKGYLGKDPSDSGWGLKFDFIIIHESGHEWFANNITYIDIADMWIHEGFTAYSENLFLDFHFGKQAGADYTIGTRKGIQNDKPIIGPYNVNKNGSKDMYSKGANLLHTIRQITNNDELWRKTLRGLNERFYHKTVSSIQVEEFISESIGLDLKYVFNQYLRDVRIPIFEYKIDKNGLNYRWSNSIDNFDMPLDIELNGEKTRLFPKNNWLEFKTKVNKLEIDRNFYVESKKKAF